MYSATTKLNYQKHNNKQYKDKQKTNTVYTFDILLIIQVYQ